MSDSKDERRNSVTLGATFLSLAVVLWFTTDNWIIALPFMVLAVTFFAAGMKPGIDLKPHEDGSD